MTLSDARLIDKEMRKEIERHHRKRLKEHFDDVCYRLEQHHKMIELFFGNKENSNEDHCK